MQAVIFDLDETVFAANDDLHDGVQELLCILRRLGVKIGALSAADHHILVRLDEAGIRDNFDDVLCSEHVAEPKAPRAVHQLLQIMDVQPRHAAFVSHAKGDIVLGRHAGVGKIIRVAHGSIAEYSRHGADHVVKDIPAVLDVLE